MESRARALGHPIHPMLIVFPLGLLAMSVIFDILYYIVDAPGLATAAFWNIIAGVIMGLIAAVFGLWDWLAIPSNTRAKRIGLLHGGGNAVVVALFFISWLLRLGSADHDPNGFGFVLEIVAVIIALGTAWLGGELVDRLGVGVSHDANLDAPSSLSSHSGGTMPAHTP